MTAPRRVRNRSRQGSSLPKQARRQRRRQARVSLPDFFICNLSVCVQLTQVTSGPGKRLRVYLSSDLNVWASIHRFDYTSSKRNFDGSDWKNDVAELSSWRSRTSCASRTRRQVVRRQQHLAAAHAGAHRNHVPQNRRLVQVKRVRFTGAHRRHAAANVARQPENFLDRHQFHLLVSAGRRQRFQVELRIGRNASRSGRPCDRRAPPAS